MTVVLSAVISRARSRRTCLREPAIRALEEMRPFAVECLKRELIRTRGQRTRQKLVELLGKISPSHDRQVTMILAQIMHDDREDTGVREAAREAIWRVDPEFEQYAAWEEEPVARRSERRPLAHTSSGIGVADETYTPDSTL